jgi:predicted nucleic acid-binding protein
LLSLTHADVQAVETILAKYKDQKFQLADACLMHLAERDGISEVLTLDKRDFGLFRTSAGKMLSLLP